MNVDQCQWAADPHTNPSDVGHESICNLPLSTLAIAIYFYYFAHLIGGVVVLR